jgi:asparagine synthase (glutamine-hydrolysing)
MQDNELDHAKKIATLFSTNHHEVILTEEHANAVLEKAIYHLDEPHADPVCIPFSCVSELAKNHHVPAILVGEGADELFMGYNIYQKYHVFNSLGLSKTQHTFSHSAKKIIAACASPFIQSNDFYQEIIHNWENDRALFWTGARPFTEAQKRSLLSTKIAEWHDPILEKIYPGLTITPDTHSIIEYHRKKLLTHLPNITLEQEICLLELQHRLPELLLMRADKMSMMHGIETRVPYLDHTVAEFALALPTNLKISWSCTKYLLKKVAERYLPKDVVYRKKQGFSVPLLHWFSKGEYFPQRLSSMTHAHGQLLSNLSLQNMSHHNTKSATKTVQQWSLLQLSLFEKNL